MKMYSQQEDATSCVCVCLCKCVCPFASTCTQSGSSSTLFYLTHSYIAERERERGNNSDWSSLSGRLASLKLSSGEARKLCVLNMLKRNCHSGHFFLPPSAS